MNDLAEFLLARLAEDEAVAHAANHIGRWQERGDDFVVVVYLDEVTPDGRSISDEDVVADGVFNPGNTAHIARWDPARVLAEVESKRQIVDLWRREAAGLNEDEIVFVMSMSEYPSGVLTMLSATLRRLILPYAGHPDFREEWRP